MGAKSIRHIIIRYATTGSLLINAEMMKIYVDHKKVKVLRRSMKSVALKVMNNLRYRYPGPIHASSISNLPEKNNIQILWEGAPPQNQHFDHYYPENFLNLSKLTFKKPFVANLKNGRVYGERGYVITTDGHILTDVNPEMSQNRTKHSLVERGYMPTPERISGTVAVLNSAGLNNYFHYLFDTLGRLQYFNKIDFNIDYYYTAYNTKFQKELLDLFGIPQNKIIKAGKNTHLEAEHLLVTSLPGDNTMADERYKPYKDYETYRYVSHVVLTKIPGTTAKDNSQFVYIQRRGNRAIENEAELLEGLQNIGSWKIVRLEEYAVIEQANLFHNAKVIVALHGAGLANLIYCKPHTTVVEITNPAYPSPLYYQISSLFQLKYYPIMGEGKAGYISKTNDIKGNVSVDVQRIVSTINEAIASYTSDGITDR